MCVKACESYVRDVKLEGVKAIVKVCEPSNGVASSLGNQVLDRIIVAYPSHYYQLLQSTLMLLLRTALNNEEVSWGGWAAGTTKEHIKGSWLVRGERKEAREREKEEKIIFFNEPCLLG